MKSLSPDYMDLERRYWKPIHEILRERGTISGWAIWRPWFGARTEFDYVTVTAFASPEGLDWIGDLPALMAAAGIDSSEVDLLSETEQRRNLVRSELWRLEAAAGPSESGGRRCRPIGNALAAPDLHVYGRKKVIAT